MTQDLQRKKIAALVSSVALANAVSSGVKGAAAASKVEEGAVDELTKLLSQATTDGRREGADSVIEKLTKVIAYDGKITVHDLDAALAEYKKELEENA